MLPTLENLLNWGATPLTQCLEQKEMIVEGSAGYVTSLKFHFILSGMQRK